MENKFVNITVNGKEWFVLSDYYKVKGIRIPMGYTEALEVAKQFDAVLPTKELVDAIWEQADLKLDPITMQPGNQMSSVGYYTRHNEMIQTQLEGKDFTLVAGHKKDIIPSQKQGRVTIYGWHRISGKPIQPVSSVHHHSYFDYSHGLRLVKPV